MFIKKGDFEFYYCFAKICIFLFWSNRYQTIKNYYKILSISLHIIYNLFLLRYRIIVYNLKPLVDLPKRTIALAKNVTESRTFNRTYKYLDSTQY